MELTKVCLPSEPKTTESVNFIIKKQTTFRPVFKFKDIDGNPLPIAGKIITFYIVDSDGDEILTIDSESTSSYGSTIIIVDDANGIVDLLITDEETSSFIFTEAKWWLSLTLLNGDVRDRGKGSITVIEPYE